MNTIQKICCVAGKSGGHILPCLSFAKQHFSSHHLSLLFISTDATLDKKIAAQFPEINDHLKLPLQNVPYRKWWRLPFFGLSFLWSIGITLRYLKKHRPSHIVSTGGFVSLPVCLAARLLGIPILLFELNVVPGKATLFLAQFATTIFICFKETQSSFKQQCVLNAYPLRFTRDDKQRTPAQARALIGLAENKKTLLILGGSQGSHFLNTLIQKMPLDRLSLYQIIHQTGIEQVAACTDFYASHGISARVFAYRDDLAPYYQAADLLICRAGAGTLFEALFFEKKTIVIPLETYTTDHQIANAQAIHKGRPDLFTVLLQNDLTQDPDLLSRQL